MAKQVDFIPPTQTTTVLEETITATEQSWTYTPFGESSPITLTLDRAKHFIAKPTRSGKLPDKRTLIEFLQVCEARRLNPWCRDAFLIGYDNKDGGAEFSVITAYQALAKRAEANPSYDGIEWGCIVKRGGEVVDTVGAFTVDGDVLVGAWATVHRKDRKFASKNRIALTEFQKNTSVWRELTRTMICKCARAGAMREAFPSDLGGLYIEEEMSHGDLSPGLSSLVTETSKQRLRGKTSDLNHRLKTSESRGVVCASYRDGTTFADDNGHKPAENIQAEPQTDGGEIAIDWTTFEHVLASADDSEMVERIRRRYLAHCADDDERAAVAMACDERDDQLAAANGGELFDRGHEEVD